MTTETVKSAAITSRDSTPPVRKTAGKGGDYNPVVVDGYLTVTTTMATGSKYLLARLPKQALVKKIELWLDAAGTTITGDVGLYYSDDSRDENGVTKGLAGNTINADHFASAVALAAVTTPTEYTFEAGTYLGADTQDEVWKASGGLSTDPGPTMLDIAFTPTATTGSTSVLNFRITYALPYTG